MALLGAFLVYFYGVIIYGLELTIVFLYGCLTVALLPLLESWARVGAAFCFGILTFGGWDVPLLAILS